MMSEREKLTMMQVMIDGREEDTNLLFTYLRMAGQIIINRAYPFGSPDDEVPARYGALQCEMAAYLYNKRGAEGQTTHDENGVKRVYAAGSIPDDMLNQIVPFVGGFAHAKPSEE